MLGRMRSRLKHWTAATAVVLVASVSLAACGDKDDDAKKDSGDSSSVGSTADTTLTKDNVFAELSKAGLKAGTSHVEMKIEVAGQSITAKGDMNLSKDPKDSSMAMTMDTGQAGAGTFEMRLVDQIFYLNFGPMTQNKFAKIDLTDKNNPIGKQYGDLLDNIDPMSQLSKIEGAVKSTEKKGAPKQIDGVKAQPYVIVVDASKVEGLSESTGGAKLPKSITYTVYIGPDNLPRRMIFELPNISGVGAGTMQADYSKWGEDVSISKPKASEISDNDPFAQLGQG
jgi:hypothetical protein